MATLVPPLSPLSILSLSFFSFHLTQWNPGLPFELLKVQISPILPFLKQFARNEIILPFLGIFSILKKIVILRPIMAKFQQNIQRRYLIYFGKFSLKIWPLFDLFSI
jgi:hypothetical protein